MENKNYKFNIILDSSSNIKSDYLKENYSDDPFVLEHITLSIAPLTILIGDKEFRDDDSIDTDLMLKELNEYKGEEHAKSSCPSIDDFMSNMRKDEYNFVITISQKLSGSYKNAVIAKQTFNEDNEIKDKDSKTFVLDSKLVAGTMELLLIKLIELIKENKSYSEIKKEIIAYRDSMNLLFVLQKFDNLVKNGRMSKVVAFIAQLANIKPLCYGEDGEIKVKEKIRTIQGALKRLVVNIEKMLSDTKERLCIISYTQCEDVALWLKDLIEKTYSFIKVKLVPNKGLAAFYSLEGGIICCF